MGIFRTSFDSLSPLGLFSLLAILTPLIGCGGGGSTAAPMTAAEAAEAGMVWNEEGEYYEYPSSQSDGYDGYSNDPYSQQASSDEVEQTTDSASTDDVADSSQSGYGSGDASGYGYSSPGYGGDNSASGYGGAEADNSSPGYGNTGSADGYGQTGTGNTSPGYEGYSNSYGGGDSIDPPADLAQQRARAAANNGYAADTYASADPYASADGYGGSPVGNGGVFAEQVEPILRARCYSCHGSGPQAGKGDLRLHTQDAISSSGVINTSSRADSELLIRIKLDDGDESRMPPKGPRLTDEEIATIERWVMSGANFGQSSGGYDGYGDGYAAGPSGADGYGRDSFGEPGSRPPAPPKNLAEAASVSFRRGNDSIAMNQLFAQTLLSSEAGKEVLQSYRWVPALKRSKLAIRWGIGVEYNPKGSYKGSPRPPGVNQDLPGVEDRNESSEAAALSDFQNSALDYYTGDIGDELLLRLQNRIEAGYYGLILQQELDKALSSGVDEFGDDDDGGGYSDDNSGGGYGGGYGGYGAGRTGGGDRAEKPDGEKIEQIMPGVTLLGEASRAVLFERAAEQGVDLLAIFDIVSDANFRIRVVNTSTRVRLYDVTSKSQLAVTGTIRNVELQRTRAEDEDDETIINEVGKLFDVADKSYKVREFPEVTTEKAKSGVIKLVQALIEESSENPLWKLAEVRFYHSRGLLKDAHAASAFNKIIPEHAVELASVTDEKQLRDVLSPWLRAPEGDGEPLAEDGVEEDGERRRDRGFR